MVSSRTLGSISVLASIFVCVVCLICSPRYFSFVKPCDIRCNVKSFWIYFVNLFDFSLQFLSRSKV